MGPVAGLPAGASRAKCPLSPEGRIPLLREWPAPKVQLSSSPQPMVSAATLAWVGPDGKASVHWIAPKDESVLEISGKNLTTKSIAWFDSGTSNFYYYRQRLVLPSEPFKIEGDYKIWQVVALFPEPGCWEITAKGQKKEWKVTLWLDPKGTD